MALIGSIKSKAHYGWAVFGLCFTNLTVEGGAKNSEAVLFVALRDSFGSSATATAAIFSAAGLFGAAAAPFLGRLLDRMGPRFLFPLAGLLILVGWFSSSFASHLWQLFILFSVIASLGHFSISSFSTTAVLAPWFPKTRGRVLGLADSGNSVGQGIFTPLAQVLVSSIGWRGAFQVLGVVFFLLVAPVNFLFQRRPPTQSAPAEGKAGLSPGQTLSESDSPEDASSHGPASVVPGSQPFAVGQISQLPSVWLLVLTRLLGSVYTQMTRLHIVAFFILAGYSELQAAAALGMVGFLSLAGRPIIGAASDSFGREITYTVGMGIAVGSIILVLLFGNGQNIWPIILFAGLAGLSDGVSGLVVGAKAADMYPSHTLGSVMGMVEMGRGIGMALGPILGGLLFGLQGDYTLAFSLAIGLTLASVCSIWINRVVAGRARY